ncbi:hypothetical protein ABZP36_010146 [Zizania latifolia]
MEHLVASDVLAEAVNMIGDLLLRALKDSEVVHEALEVVDDMPAFVDKIAAAHVDAAAEVEHGVEEAAGEVPGFVVASVEFEVLTAMVDAAEAAAELLILGVGESGPDSEVGMAPCVGADWAVELEAEHMEQIEQELEPHSGHDVLVLEVASPANNTKRVEHVLALDDEQSEHCSGYKQRGSFHRHKQYHV